MNARDTEIVWRAGELGYKLFPHQKVGYEKFRKQINGKRNRRGVWRWSRRTGKTGTAEILGCETCIKVPGARIAVVAPTKDMLTQYVRPAIERIIVDAPPDLKPVWRSSEDAYVFPNGSRIDLYGASNETAIDNIGRGPAAHGIIIEEGGHISNLRKLIKVVSPQLLSNRAKPGCGWMLVVGTPPDSSAHHFVSMCRAARDDDREVHMTIWDACPGMYSAEVIRAFIEEDAEGIPYEEYIKTEDYRREYLGELISDPTRKVLKLADEKNLKACVERYHAAQRPTHFAVYEALDVGWAPDWSFWLMGWWDYNSRTLVVEREWYMREGMRPDDLASNVKRIEEEVLGKARASRFHIGWREPSRWSDYSPHLLAEVADKHSLVFQHTAKDDRDTAISNCDRMVAGYGSVGKLAINPEGCPELLKQMEAAIWNKQRTEFAKDNPKRHGHYDGVAALIYLTRNVQREENPFPPNYMDVNRNTHFVLEEPDTRRPSLATWQNAFGLTGDDYGLC
jgi:hypothetical protein